MIDFIVESFIMAGAVLLALIGTGLFIFSVLMGFACAVTGIGIVGPFISIPTGIVVAVFGTGLGIMMIRPLVKYCGY